MKNKYIGILMTFIGICTGYSQEDRDASTMDYNNISMPSSPTSASFGEFGNSTVNIPMGIPTINIPIYTLEIDGVQVPISLAYDATGIKVGSLATSVGLNWSLEVGGQFSRTVRGKADEYNGWFDPDYSFITDDYFDGYDPSNPRPWQRDMMGHSFQHHDGKAKRTDHMPDMFSYSFMGYSNSFINNTNTNFLMEKQDGLVIDIDEDSYATVNDLQGNFYEFRDTEESNNKMIFTTDSDLVDDFFEWEQGNGHIPKTAWKLSKITTKNNKTINFQYDNVPFSYEIQKAESSLTLGGACRDIEGSRSEGFSATNITYSFNTKLIRKISSPDGNIEIVFNYGTDNIPTPAIWKTKLNSIVITDLLKGEKKEFHFIYNRYSGDPRLQLAEMYEVGYSANNQQAIKPSYKFTYKSGSLPSKSSFSQDFFGYFNASSGPNSLVHMTASEISKLGQYSGYAAGRTRDRSPNSSVLQNGILTKIQYPTGGSTELTYEMNMDNQKYYGGLRLRQIEDIDETGSYNRKTYQYDKAYGANLTDNRIDAIKSVGINGRSYHSSFVRTPGSLIHQYKPGYFYGKVSILHSSGVDGFREEYYFEEDELSLHKFSYSLKEKKYFKGNSSQLLKVEEYFNDRVGEIKSYEWNILGDMMCFTPPYGKGFLGHNNVPIKIYHYHNYSFIPTKIATTDFLKSGSSLAPVTLIQEISYDPKTLLTVETIKDYRYTRTGDRQYALQDSNGEKITTLNKYPFIPVNAGFNNSFPKGLLIHQEVFSRKNSNSKIAGQAFEFDLVGNIKKTYSYHKGKKSNNSNVGYIPSDYEEQSSFLFKNGNPVQVSPKIGSATSYIWAHKGQYPVAKIEGRSRGLLNQQKLTAIENASYTALPAALAALRTDASVQGTMITTFTHAPLFGVETITDPKGEMTTYKYDPFGRLDHIKDANGNILTENEYNYGQ